MSYPKPKYKVGDWICFINAGRLRYSKVEYVEMSDSYPYTCCYYTPEGLIYESSVLEVRRATEE